jgi:hypothetical protein
MGGDGANNRAQHDHSSASGDFISRSVTHPNPSFVQGTQAHAPRTALPPAKNEPQEASCKSTNHEAQPVLHMIAAVIRKPLIQKGFFKPLTPTRSFPAP